MRFTAVMDEIDEESFRRGPGSVGAGAVLPRADSGRQERCRGAGGQSLSVEVRGLDTDARHRIREELQLLAALEVAGITAAPSVLEIEEDGYQRESAPPLLHRPGRRVAEDSAPPTAERLALARARDDLDDLIGELHQRGWVLGARPGQGLGVRADGSVVVLDLHGLERGETLSARQGDRRWVDSVLEDQQRTLRRRIDVVTPSWPLRESLLRSSDPGAEVQAPGGREDTGWEMMPEVAEPLEACPLTEKPRDGTSAGGTSADAALPSPRRIRRRHDEGRAVEGPQGRHALHPAGHVAPVGALRVAWNRSLSVVRQVLSQPPLRRVAVGSALVVLLLGSTAAMGVWWASERPAQAPGHEQSPVQTSVASSEVPQIEDPWALTADVAGARHAYVTGVSEQPAAAPGSEALAADEETRLAYRDFQVRGGGPVVHDAQLLVGPDLDGTVVLRAVTSTAEHELEDSAGQLTVVPATAPREVRLTLRWEDGSWLIVTVEPVTEVAGTS